MTLNPPSEKKYPNFRVIILQFLLKRHPNFIKTIFSRPRTCDIFEKKSKKVYVFAMQKYTYSESLFNTLYIEIKKNYYKNFQKFIK